MVRDHRRSELLRLSVYDPGGDLPHRRIHGVPVKLHDCGSGHDPGNHPLRGKAYTAGNDQCHGSDRPHLPWNRRLRSGTVHLDKELIPLTGSDLFPVLPVTAGVHNDHGSTLLRRACHRVVPDRTCSHLSGYRDQHFRDIKGKVIGIAGNAGCQFG